MTIGIDARLWNETGVGRYIRNLVWQLEAIDRKNDYILFVSNETSEEFKKKKVNFKKNFRVVATDIRWHTVEEQLQFPKVLENEQLDLVHFPYFSVPILYKGRFVITIHDLIINHFPTGKASTLPLPMYHMKHLGYKFVMKEAARKAKNILTVSNATKREIVDHLHVSADKITVTYEGVDKRLDSHLRANNKYGKYFLYVGNAYPHKNLERLIEVFELLSSEGNDCKLFLVGKEDYFYKQLKEKVKVLKLENTVSFLGKVSDEELATLYDHAIGLISPSLMEGFGLPGLEAMQHGTLVIAANIPVYKEIYKDVAIYFDPLDVSDMHATILKVLENKEDSKRFKEKGLQLAKSFSWEKMAKETLTIYESSISI